MYALAFSHLSLTPDRSRGARMAALASAIPATIIPMIKASENGLLQYGSGWRIWGKALQEAGQDPGLLVDGAGLCRDAIQEVVHPPAARNPSTGAHPGRGLTPGACCPALLSLPLSGGAGRAG